MQQTAGGRSQAIGSLNVCGCNGLPGSDCRCCCSDPMAPPVDSCSIVLSAYGCLCAFVQTTQATCEDRRSYRFDRVSPESVLRALPWKHRRVHCQSSECRELRMDESVMVSSVSGRTAVLDCCFAIGMRGRSVCACLLMRCSRARPGLVESTHRSNQTSVSGPGATSGAFAAEVQLQDAWAMDDARATVGTSLGEQGEHKRLRH